MNSIRAVVSGARNRFRDEAFDLDLSYITPRIIAMGLPSSGLESMYRNSIDAVSAFLERHHGGHTLVVNLSERKYDYSKFGNQVVECGFPDHYAPPLELVWNLCHAINAWLAQDKRAVIAVHCLAGKGRTGVVVTCYLLFLGMFRDASLSPDEVVDRALTFFLAKRGEGVGYAAQRRCCVFFEMALRLHDGGAVAAPPASERARSTDAVAQASSLRVAIAGDAPAGNLPMRLGASAVEQDMAPSQQRTDGAHSAPTTGGRRAVLKLRPPEQLSYFSLTTLAADEEEAHPLAPAALATPPAGTPPASESAPAIAPRAVSVALRLQPVQPDQDPLSLLQSTAAHVSPAAADDGDASLSPAGEREGAAACSPAATGAEAAPARTVPRHPAQRKAPRAVAPELDAQAAALAPRDRPLDFPHSPELLLVGLALRGAPGYSPAEDSCNAVAQVQQTKSQVTHGRLLYNSAWHGPRPLKRGTAEWFQVDKVVCGDITIALLHVLPGGNSVQMLRTNVHTLFVKDVAMADNVPVPPYRIELHLDDVDVPKRSANAARYPPTFRLDLFFDAVRDPAGHSPSAPPSVPVQVDFPLPDPERSRTSSVVSAYSATGDAQSASAPLPSPLAHQHSDAGGGGATGDDATREARRIGSVTDVHARASSVTSTGSDSGVEGGNAGGASAAGGGASGSNSVSGGAAGGGSRVVEAGEDDVVNPRPTCVGYLHKQGAWVRNWKRRWFVLRGTQLMYFRSPYDAEPLGVVDLSAMRGADVAEPADVGGRLRCFHLLPQDEGRVYSLQAESDKSMTEWVNAVNRVALGLAARRG